MNSKIGNMNKIMKKVIKMGKIRIVRVKSVGFNAIEIECRDVHSANKMLNTNNLQVEFKVPERKQRVKGVINGWDKTTHYMNSMMLVEKEKILSMECMVRRRYERETRVIILEPTDGVIVT